jgi:hypothetical protein
MVLSLVLDHHDLAAVREILAVVDNRCAENKNIPSIVFLAVLLAFAGGLGHHPRSRHTCYNISDSGKISFRSLAAFE